MQAITWTHLIWNIQIQMHVSSGFMPVLHCLVPKVIAMWTCVWCSPFTKLWVLQCPFVHKSGCVWTQALFTSSSVATENLHYMVYHSLLWAVTVGKWPSYQQCPLPLLAPTWSALWWVRG
jgi:hypothetical protein